MSHTWNHTRASDHIDRKLEDVSQVEIVEYVRDMSLESIPKNKAYRIDGVHLYADILNLGDMLNVTKEEGVESHKRTLHFLNMHYRAVSRILTRTDVRRVDFHNQRLHALIAKPYNTQDGAEALRIHRAIAVGKMIIDVLNATGDEHIKIPSAKVRVGIDSGQSLAVNNGRNGNRESLFLGEPANFAAKMSGGGKASGIFLTNVARQIIDLPTVDNPKATALTISQIKASEDISDLDVTMEEIVKEWKDDLEKNPIGAFEFSAHTPPLSTLQIASLTPANSRRQDAVSMYADLDGFTAYVSKHINENAEDVVKVFHVLRAELERVLSVEFKGRRIRFIGDCVHGLICEGTVYETDSEETISTATLCAAGMRSSFNLALDKLQDKQVNTDGLGLQIGFEYGPMTVTRLGIQGDRVRCSVSRGVLQSETEQGRCGSAETAIGQLAYDLSTDAVKQTFGPERKTANLDYNEAVESLSSHGDLSAKASKSATYAVAAPAVARAAERSIKPHAN